MRLLEIGDSVLLSGENGAGKLTLLDAIQFVITASKNNFNKAAHENGKRKLSRLMLDVKQEKKINPMSVQAR